MKSLERNPIRDYENREKADPVQVHHGMTRWDLREGSTGITVFLFVILTKVRSELIHETRTVAS